MASHKISGLVALKGKVVTLFCANYIYTGKLISVTKSSVLLEDCAVVYETGDFDTTAWKDAQKIHSDWNIHMSRIESFGVMKKKKNVIDPPVV